MAHLKDEVYRPNPEAKPVYDELYAEYQLLHDYFGRGSNDDMKRLKAMRSRILADRGPRLSRHSLS
jgi:L-ribulokinase